ncbi:MAG: ankyrin repeat domain-containing protein [Spirochaetales bacterium]|nr:ankyrin repeat domain-containing protein [Leptospiraceae bacterium]MCP5481476.1 ankyrin repeat domain-containing protein [Spirochaetales bacterium]MCP5484305.1 ankyrin repeat domain-containing protein [Spirochaetales bacterium]
MKTSLNPLIVLAAFFLIPIGLFAENDPLYEAIAHRNLGEVQRLVQSGASVDVVRVDGMESAPLAWACATGAFEIGHYLLEQGANPDGSASYDTALWWCAFQLNKGHDETDTVELSRAILNAGAQVDLLKQPINNGTALMAAAGNNSRALVDLLLQHGADRTLRDRNGKNAADRAQSAGHIEMANYLRGESNDDYRNSLIYAVRSNDLARVQAIVGSRNGAARALLINEVEAQSERTALHYAALEGNLEIATYLIDNGADINRASVGNYTPLITAAAFQKSTVARLLVDRGAELDVVQSSGCATGYTALLWAVTHGDYDLTAYLLAKGANPYASYNPLLTVVSTGQLARSPELAHNLVERHQVRPDQVVFGYLKSVVQAGPATYRDYPGYHDACRELLSYLTTRFPDIAALRARALAPVPEQNQIQASFEPLDVRTLRPR